MRERRGWRGRGCLSEDGCDFAFVFLEAESHAVLEVAAALDESYSLVTAMRGNLSTTRRSFGTLILPISF